MPAEALRTCKPKAGLDGKIVGAGENHGYVAGGTDVFGAADSEDDETLFAGSLTFTEPEIQAFDRVSTAYHVTGRGTLFENDDIWLTLGDEDSDTMPTLKSSDSEGSGSEDSEEEDLPLLVDTVDQHDENFVRTAIATGHPSYPPFDVVNAYLHACLDHPALSPTPSPTPCPSTHGPARTRAWADAVAAKIRLLSLSNTANHHYWSLLKYLHDYRAFDSPRNIGGVFGSVGVALGSGTLKVIFTLDDGSKHAVVIHDVYFVPGLGANLISAGQLFKQGVGCVASPTRVTLTHANSSPFGYVDINTNGTMLLNASFVRSSSLSPRNPILSSDQALFTYPADCNLWHRRLGHCGGARLDQVLGMVDGLSFCNSTPLSPCIKCSQGKITRKSVRKVVIRQATFNLERIAVDLLGPSRVVGLGGARYIFAIVDQHSRYLFGFAQQLKSQALPNLQTWALRAERLQGRHIVGIRSDHGGETKSNAMTAWTSLLESGLPLFLWVECYLASIYVKNKLPTRGLIGPNLKKTPHEVWFKKKPDLSNLRVWGCEVVVHYSLELRKDKATDRGWRGFMVGYLEVSAAWRIYNPAKRMVVKSPDVDFFEDVFRTTPPSEERLSQIRLFDHDLPRSNAPLLEIPVPRPFMLSWEADLSPKPVTPSITTIPAAAPPSIPTPPASRIPRLATRLLQLPPLLARHSCRTRLAFVSSSSSASPEIVELITSTLNSDGKPVWFDVPTNSLRLPGGGLGHNSSPPTVRPQIVSPTLEPQDDALLASSKIDLEALLHELLPSTPDPSQPILSGAQLSLDDALDYTVYAVQADFSGESCPITDLHSYNAWSGSVDEPILAQAMRGPDRDQWLAAVHKELAMLRAMVRQLSVRAILALAAQNGWKLEQFDVSSAYLHGTLKEEVYLRQPPGFGDDSNPSGVLRLRKSLYGLCQAGHEWNDLLHSTLTAFGMTRTGSDHGVYHIQKDGGTLILAIHVDNGLVASSSPSLSKALEAFLQSKFDVDSFVAASIFLGLRITQDLLAGTVTVDQRGVTAGYVAEFLGLTVSPVSTPCDPKLHLVAATPAEAAALDPSTPYRAAIGALLWLSLSTRPDIAFAVSVVGRHSAAPGVAHWTTVKRIFCYLAGTPHYGLVYRKVDVELVGVFDAFSDADHAGHQVSRKSTSGFVIRLASAVISWLARLQKSLSISTTEAEYMGLSACAMEVVWLRALFSELGFRQPEATLIRGDNMGSISLAKHPTAHQRTKHIAIHYHFTRDKVATKEVVLRWIPTAEMVADVMTKGLDAGKHRGFSADCGLSDVLREGEC
ncbi:hypothetical protein P7C70_g5791, partial [Phenoliferia sp. Uapishka_3]